MRPATLFILWEMQQERWSSGVKAIASTVAGLVPSLSAAENTGGVLAHMGGELIVPERMVKGKIHVCRSLLSTPHRQNTQESE